MMQIIQQLIQLGFSHDEAIIYLNLLQIGSGPASTIARKTNLQRLATHNYLEGLRKKGIVSIYLHDSTTRYCPLPFAELQQKIAVEREQKLLLLKDLEKNINTFLDSNKIYQQQPEFTLFTGLEGIKSFYEETLMVPDFPLYAYIGTDQMKDALFLDYLYGSYIPRRNLLIQDIKTIFCKTAFERYYENHQQKGRIRREERVKCIDENQIPLSGGIILYAGHKVAVTSYNLNSITAACYSSEAYYKTMMGIFLHLWEKDNLFLP